MASIKMISLAIALAAVGEAVFGLFAAANADGSTRQSH
jgi:hypothetical protein